MGMKKLGIALIFGALGIAAVGSIESQSAERDEKYTYDLLEKAHQVRKGELGAPNDPSSLLKGRERDTIESISNGIVGSVLDFSRRDGRLLNIRKSALITMAYEGHVQNTPVYENFLRDIAEHEDDASIRMQLLKYAKDSGDKRFVGILAQRPKPDNPMRFELEEKLLDAMTQEDALAYSLDRLSGPDGIEKDAHIRRLSKIGGRKALGYLMSHFDEIGIEYSRLLMDAVRTDSEGRMVYNFLQKKFHDWDGPCNKRAYSVSQFRNFANQYGDGVKAVQCANHDSKCFYKPFGIAAMESKLHCDENDCICRH